MNSETAPQPTAPTQPASAPPHPPAYPFSILFLVWLLIIIIATLVTFILPESYASTARIKVDRDVSDIRGMIESPPTPGYDPYFIQTEFEVIQSELVLSNVIQSLDLAVMWGEKYGGGQRLRIQEAMMLLKNRMDLRPVRNTSLIEIRVYSENNREAADIANAIAEAYRDYRLSRLRKLTEGGIQALLQRYEEQEKRMKKAQEELETLRKKPESGWPLEEAKRRIEELQRLSSVLVMKIASEEIDIGLPKTTMVEIVDRATAAMLPVRPNKPLNIMLGILVGAISGLILATVVYVLQRVAYHRALGNARTQLPPRIRAIVHIAIALVVGVVIGYHCATPLAIASLIMTPLALVLGGGASAYLELRNQDDAAPPRRAEQHLTSKY